MLSGQSFKYISLIIQIFFLFELLFFSIKSYHKLRITSTLWFFAFFIFGFVAEVGLTITSHLGHRNLWIVNIFIPFEVLVYCRWMYSFHSNTRIQLIISGSAVTLLTIWLVELTVYGANAHLKYIGYIEPFVFMLLAGSLLVRSIRFEDGDLLKKTSFWVYMGLLLYNSMFVVTNGIFGLLTDYHVIKSISGIQALGLQFMNIIVYYFYYHSLRWAPLIKK